MVSILLIVFLMLFLGMNFLAFAFCRSAALADKKLESFHVSRATDFTSAITRPTRKRAPGNNGTV